MYLLDTHVISELRRPKPHGAVVAWFAAHKESKAHLAAVVVGEIQAGIEATRAQDSAKADEIERWLERMLVVFDTLPMDERCFREHARIMHGKSDDQLEDAMIAATARVHGLTVVTRNVADFNAFDVSTINPFDHGT